MTTIAIDKLVPDSRNANVCSAQTLNKLKRNIQKRDLYPAIVVRPHPEKADHYVIVDGHHRVQILKELGKDKALCQVFHVSEEEAGLLLATLNTLRGTDNVQKRALLIEELTRFMPQDELATLLPESEKDIQDLLELARLDFSAMEETFREALKAEEASLPVPLSFLVSRAEAELIEKTLNAFNSQDRAAALVALCEHARLHLNDEEIHEQG